MSEQRIFRFPQFTLDVDRGSLLVNGEPTKLRPKSFQVLQFMAENPGRLLSKDDLLAKVWGQTIVTEDAVAQCIIDIRRALGDSDQTVVKTVPRRGYVLDVDPLPFESGLTQRLRNRWPVLGGALLVLIGIASWWVISQEHVPAQAGAQREAATPVSIAVLPFLDLSEDSDLGYFAEGVAEEVINLLTQVDELHVIARTSSFSRQVRGADIASVQQLLNVSHVLEGSVRKSGNIVRVSVQLINADSGERVWTQDYERELGHILAMQDEIASEVLNRLVAHLRVEVPESPGSNAEAYGLYLQALHMLNTAPPQKLAEIEDLVVRSLEIDPTFAPGWREYSRVLFRKVGRGTDPLAEIQAMKDALQKAYELDPHDAATLAYLAWQALDFEGDIEKSARLFAEAFAAGPANENVLRPTTIFVTAFGSKSDAVRLAEYGVSTNPLCLPCFSNLAVAYEQNGQFQASIRTVEEMVSVFDRGKGRDAFGLVATGQAEELLLRHDSEVSERQRLFERAVALQSLGRFEEADESVQQYAELTKDEIPWGIAMLYAWTQNKDAAFAALHDAVEQTQVVVDGQIVRPDLISIGRLLRIAMLESLHDDPRWKELHEQYEIYAPDLSELSELIARLEVN